MAFRKLTPDVKERVLHAIRLGATYELACQYAGISRQTLHRYRKDVTFVTEVEKAEGEAAVAWLAVIQDAARDGEWTAAAWKLERRYPHLYGRRVMEVSGRDGGPIGLALAPFDYGAAVDELDPAGAGDPGPARLGPGPAGPAPGSNGHHPPPGQVAGRRDGPPLGEDADGG